MNDPHANDQNPEYIPPGALEAISRAEIDIAISTARKYPQHSPDKLAQVKQNMLSFATLDQETAESCFYSVPRGGKMIQGPSVRLAEIAVACYGNLRAGTRIIETVMDGNDPHVVIQAVAIDLEKNVQVSIEKRRRITKKKSKDKPDEDDLNLATNACSAIAFRDSVYKVIPLALIKPVYEAAKKVAVGDAKTLVERRSRMLDTFQKMGVPKERVLLRLGKTSPESIDLPDIELLIGLFNAIKEGELPIEEAFPVNRAPEPTAHAQATGVHTTPLPTPPIPPAVPSNPDEQAEAAAGLAPQVDAKPTQAPSVQPEAKPDPAKPAETTTAVNPPPANLLPVIQEADSRALKGAKGALITANVTEKQLLAVLVKKKIAKPDQKLADLAEMKLDAIARTLGNMIADVRSQPWE